jgi:hypothetical protein
LLKELQDLQDFRNKLVQCAASDRKVVIKVDFKVKEKRIEKVPVKQSPKPNFKSYNLTLFSESKSN